MPASRAARRPGSCRHPTRPAVAARAQNELPSPPWCSSGPLLQPSPPPHAFPGVPTMLDADLKAQLSAYREKLQQPIELVAPLDDSDKSRALREPTRDSASASGT